MAEGMDVPKKGSFLLKNKTYNISISTDSLKWEQTVGKTKDEVTVPFSEILSVSTEESKKNNEQDTLNICYIERKKNNILKKANIVFKGSYSECTEWTKYIQQGIDEVKQRPRKMLVLINPVSGGGKARKVYLGKVAPIFKVADIQTDVIVTERAHHTEEVISKYDLSTIDSIVVVGGDGTYHELGNGLLRKAASDANIDINNSDNELPEIGLPIGIIPCGTGNGIAADAYGNKDVETAALSIVVGRRTGANLYGVYCSGELVAYSVLLVAYGFWGDMIHAAESRRSSQDVMRYPIALIEHIYFKTPRTVDLTINYKRDLSTTAPPCQQDTTQHDSDRPNETVNSTEIQEKSANNEDTISIPQSNSDWITVNGTYIGILAIYSFDIRNKGKVRNPRNNTTVILSKVGSIASFVFRFLTRYPALLQHESVEHFSQFKEMKWKLNEGFSDPESQIGIKQRVLNIDGDVFMLKQPEIVIKYFSGKLKLFSNVEEDGFCCLKIHE